MAHGLRDLSEVSMHLLAGRFPECDRVCPGLEGPSGQLHTHRQTPPRDPVSTCLLGPSNLAFPILGLQVHVGGAPSISGASRLAAEVWGSPLPSVLFFLTGLSAPRAFTQGSSQRPCPALGCVSNSATLWQHLHTPRRQGVIPQLWEVEPGWPAGGCRLRTAVTGPAVVAGSSTEERAALSGRRCVPLSGPQGSLSV